MKLYRHYLQLFSFFLFKIQKNETTEQKNMTQSVLSGNLSMNSVPSIFEQQSFEKFQNFKQCVVGYQKLSSSHIILYIL